MRTFIARLYKKWGKEKRAHGRTTHENGNLSHDYDGLVTGPTTPAYVIILCSLVPLYDNSFLSFSSPESPFHPVFEISIDLHCYLPQSNHRACSALFSSCGLSKRSALRAEVCTTHKQRGQGRARHTCRRMRLDEDELTQGDASHNEN